MVKKYAEIRIGEMFIFQECKFKKITEFKSYNFSTGSYWVCFYGDLIVLTCKGKML